MSMQFQDYYSTTRFFSGNKYFFFVFVCLVFTPIFFVFADGVVYFDTVGEWHPNLKKSLLPPLPISQVLMLFSLYYVRSIVKSKYILYFFVLTIIVASLNVLYHGYFPRRFVVIAVEVMQLFVVYKLFTIFVEKAFFEISDVYKYRVIGYSVMLIGLIYLASYYVFELEVFNFISKEIAIYSYYTYFPILFAAAFLFCFSYRKLSLNLLDKFIPVAMFVIAVYISKMSSARVVEYSIYFSLIVYFIVVYLNKMVGKILSFRYVFFFMLLVIFLYITLSYVGLYDSADVSLDDRARMISDYIDSTGLYSYFLPIFSEYRLHHAGSMHNAWLEIFSQFGWLGIVIVYGFIYKAVLNSNAVLQSSALLVFIMFQSLAQLSLYHIYTTNILVLLLVIHQSMYKKV